MDTKLIKCFKECIFLSESQTLILKLNVNIFENVKECTLYKIDTNNLFCFLFFFILLLILIIKILIFLSYRLYLKIWAIIGEDIKKSLHKWTKVLGTHSL